MRKLSLLLGFLVVAVPAFAQYTLTSQQPVSPASYSSNGNSVTTKPLPANILSHCYGNVACPAGDAIAKCAMTDCGNLSELVNVISMGRLLKASPGASDFGNPVYYPTSADPWYSVLAATPAGKQTVSFHCPNAAAYSGGAEHELTCWDQSTGWVVELYTGGSPQNNLTLPPASGCGSTQATACNATTAFQSAASNLFTSIDYGYVLGSNASNGFAPVAAMTREEELCGWNGSSCAGTASINHALMFTVDCVNNTTPYMFPANQSPGLCGSGIFGPTNANRASAGTLLFLDYTSAQLSTICASVPAWQCTLLTAFLKYGAYISETGGANVGLDLVGDENLESTQAWKFANPGGTCNGTGCYSDPLWPWLLPQKGLDGTANLTHTGCFAGGPSGGSSPRSTWECEGAMLANIGQVVTAGSASVDSEGHACGSGSGCYPSGHIHVADKCVALGFAGQPGGCTAVTASTPTFSPGAGTYTASQSVTISTTSPGAILCYNFTGAPATNGATGCAVGSTLYTTPVYVNVTETLYAVAGGTGYIDSSVGSASYVLQGSAPTFSPATGTYTGAQTVTISQTQGLTRCYTTDGSTPTSNGSGSCAHGTQYSGPITVGISETLKAIGIASGWTDSAVASAAYVILYPLTQTVSGLGSVSSSPLGINNCTASSGTCFAVFASGSIVTLTATPGSNYVFSAWGGAGAACGSSLSCPITMSAAESVSATFLPAPPPIPAVSRQGFVF
jgi:hypothetical protein